MPTPPLKRSPHLYRFSHEHHDGLVVASCIKAGVKKDADAEIIAQYILSFWSSCVSVKI